jgi:hypothetical protein
MESSHELLEQRNKEIDDIYQKNKDKFKDYFSNIYTADHKLEIKVILAKLNNIQEKIEDKYNLIYADMREKYDMSDETSKYIDRIFRQASSLDFFNPNINDSPNIQDFKEIPLDLLSMVRKQLQCNNIPAETIDVTYSEDVLCAISPELSCTIYTDPVLKKDFLQITRKSKGLININKTLLRDLPLSAKEGLCISIVDELYTHINCTIFRSILQIVLQKKISEEELYPLPFSFSNLSLLELAINNKQKAYLLKSYYKHVNEEFFSLNSYKMLFKIDRLYRILEWLKKYTIKES